MRRSLRVLGLVVIAVVGSFFLFILISAVIGANCDMAY